MKKSTLLPALAGVLAMACCASARADDEVHASVRLSGYQEVPALASSGSGRLKLRLAAGQLGYELSYRGLEGAVTQAHIHFGQKGVNGGVSVFLCSNLGNGPAGTPVCPSPEGMVSGSISAAGVIGPASQNILPGQFDQLLRAMRSGVTYVNVHSSKFPGGEIRGQISHDD